MIFVRHRLFPDNPCGVGIRLGDLCFALSHYGRKEAGVCLFECQVLAGRQAIGDRETEAPMKGYHSTTTPDDVKHDVCCVFDGDLVLPVFLVAYGGTD